MRSLKPLFRRGRSRSSEPGSTPAPSPHPQQQRDAPLLDVPPQPSQDAQASASTGAQSDTPALSSSSLWEKAMESVSQTEDWKKYCRITGQTQSASQGGNTASQQSPAEVIATVTLISKTIEEAQTSFQLGKRSVVVREVCSKVIGTLKGLKDAGTALTGLNPYASMAWSGLQIFVQMLSTAKEVREMCWEVLPRATYLISRYQTMEVLYANDQNPQQSRSHMEQILTELFTLVLEYQMAMVIHLKSRFRRIETSFGKAADSPLQAKWTSIKDKEVSLLGLQAVVDREIDNEQFRLLLDTTSFLQNSLDQTWDEVQDISRLVGNSYRREVLAWVSDIYYENDHNASRRAHLAKTGDWLLTHEYYRNWQSSSASARLWLSGLMGSGKSCLSHAVIENIKVMTDPNHGQQLAYFYIDGAQARGDQDYATKVLCCLLKQLAHPGSETKLMNAVINAFEKQEGRSNLTEKQAVHLIQEILDLSTTTFLVLDGLDECDEVAQGRLMRFASQFSADPSGKVKVFVASRVSSHISDIMEEFKPQVIYMDQNNAKDIEELIFTQIEESNEDLRLRRLYKRGSQDQTADVINALRENAQGMFRWVQMAFDHLHSSQDFETMQDRLEELPRLQNLFDLYDLIYETALKNLGPRSQRALRMALSMILYIMKLSQVTPYIIDSGNERFLTRSPSVARIIAAVGYARQSLTGTYAAQDVWELCPSFISFHRAEIEPQEVEAESEFRFPHFSVREWLLDRRHVEYGPRAGHGFLARACLQMLVDPEHCGATETFSVHNFKRYASACWFYHTYLLRMASNSWDEILENDILADLINKFLLESPAPAPFITWSTGYQRWIENTFATLSTTTPIIFVTSPPSTILARLALGLRWKDSRFVPEHIDLVSLVSLVSFKELGEWTPTHMATAMHNCAAVEWLASSQADLLRTAQISEVRTESLFRAVYNTPTSVLQPITPAQLNEDDAEIIAMLLSRQAMPHIPKGPGPYTEYDQNPYYISLIGATLSELELVLMKQDSSSAAAVLLFEDGANRVDFPTDWYLMALWTSVISGHDFKQWLLDRWNDHVKDDTTLCRAGRPASRYLLQWRWEDAPSGTRRQFVTEIASCVGKTVEELEEEQGWDLGEGKWETESECESYGFIDLLRSPTSSSDWEICI